MATTEIEQLKALTDGGQELTDIELQNIIDSEGGVKQAAVEIWRRKAATTASMVNISESGSSRNLGDLHKQYLTMADTIARSIEVEATAESSFKRTRRAVRR